MSSHFPAQSRREFVRDSAAIALAPILMACSHSTGSSESSARLSARPGAPTLAPPAGLTELNIGGSRDGILYVPGRYSPDTAAPLFVGLHGAGGDADNWTSYPDRAEANGMIFLAVDSRDRTWDLVLGDFGPDVEFLNRALQYTFDRVRIDPAHIALGGFSDGASYALSLGLSNGDLFSHLVGFSPGFLRSAETIGKPPIYISHGRGDNILPIGATSDVIVPDLRRDGYEVTYEQFDGGHEVPSEISDSALDWFLL